MSSALGDIYTGAADFGKFSTIIGGIFGTLFALLFVGIGIYLLVEAFRRTKSVQAKITKSECENTTSSNRMCKITIEYPSNQPSKMCSVSFSVEDEAKYKPGNTITVYYDPSDPCNTGSLDTRRESYIFGLILLIGGLVFILIIWLVVYLTFRYKFFAAAEGVGTAVKILT